MPNTIYTVQTDGAVHRSMEAIFGPSCERLDAEAGTLSRRSNDVEQPMASSRRRSEIASIGLIFSVILLISAASSMVLLSLRGPEAEVQQRRLPTYRQSKPAPNQERRLPEYQQSQREAGAAIQDAATDRSPDLTVRAFYAALGRGDGEEASALVVPEKRTSRAFSSGAMSRFYGALPQRIRLTRLSPLSSRSFRVAYRYSAGSASCNGEAIVTLDSRGNQSLIQSIRALNGC
jgi:hypothetical protein